MLKIFNFIIFCLAVLIIVSFFMPWVQGEASLLKPIEDSTKAIQESDFTGLARGSIKISRKIVDSITQALSGKKLNQTLKGFQIPLVAAEKGRRIVYLLYIVPVFAILCWWLSVLGNRKKYFDATAALIALGIFAIFYKQMSVLNREGLFVNIKACCWLPITINSFLAIGVLAFLKFYCREKLNPES
ncbi:MAG: hypothetical protein ABH954_05535 [Candidatus Omnitrophota bacterium]